MQKIYTREQNKMLMTGFVKLKFWSDTKQSKQLSQSSISSLSHVYVGKECRQTHKSLIASIYDVLHS